MDSVKKMAGAQAREMPCTVDELGDAPYNPRRIADVALDGLEASLREFGDLSGLVFNHRTGHLVSGHQRRRALKRLGVAAIEWEPEAHDTALGPEWHGVMRVASGAAFRVRGVDWSASKERRANVTANNPHIAGEWDETLAALLADIQVDDPHLFADLRLDELLGMEPADDGDLQATDLRLPEEEHAFSITCPADVAPHVEAALAVLLAVPGIKIERSVCR